jgi:2,4-didehydro-3-deoxy-L-rhamnonate hydrolase
MMTYGIATVATGGREQAALVRDDRFVLLSHWGEERSLIELLRDWDAVTVSLEKWAGDEEAFHAALALDDVRICLPYRPGQIFCTGANYKKHVVGLIMGDPSMRTAEHDNLSPEDLRRKAEEQMEKRGNALPFCFIKLSSCAVGPQDEVILPSNVEKPDWELELGVVMGKRTHRVPAEDAMEHVAGYAIVNDVTAREHIFRRDGSALGADWLSGKCFPTFLPFGPMIVPRSQIADPYDLTITLAVNGRVYQNESTSDMMTSIARQIAYLSERVVLEPGDVICTGSPYGNGSAFGVFLQPGDEMVGSITHLGTQHNRCVAE